MNGEESADGVRVPAVDLSQMLICPRCKVDRKQAPCGDPHYGVCPMTGIASGVMAAPVPVRLHEGKPRDFGQAQDRYGEHLDRPPGVAPSHAPDPKGCDYRHLCAFPRCLEVGCRKAVTYGVDLPDGAKHG